jgi:biopolymer transport protein ExbD
MAFSSNSGGGPMADINVTPLVDVMLVLLIIFMITAPLMSHKVQVDLPKATLEEKPKMDQPPITLAIKPNGQVYWNDVAVTREKLDANLAILAQKTPQPQVDIRSDNITKYGVINAVVLKVRGAGIRKVGFVSSPER